MKSKEADSDVGLLWFIAVSGEGLISEKYSESLNLMPPDYP